MSLHETHIRVRYQETDNMGVVYYANYFVWFEVARTEYLRSFGISYKQLEDKGMYLMVVDASCVYKSPARYDDVVKIAARVSGIKNSSLQFEYKLYVDSRLVATGKSTHVFTNASGKPVRVPSEIRALGDKDARENSVITSG